MKHLFILAAVLLGGCAALPEGVTMSDEEREACKAQGCTVWTEDELRTLFIEGVKRGAEMGRRRSL